MNPIKKKIIQRLFFPTLLFFSETWSVVPDLERRRSAGYVRKKIEAEKRNRVAHFEGRRGQSRSERATEGEVPSIFYVEESHQTAYDETS